MSKKQPIDRTKTCPFLMRVFWKENGFHPLENFAEKGKETADDEIQIYTWKDAKLREIVDLIKSSLAIAQKPDARFEFSFVFQDMHGNWRRKEVGQVHSVKKSRDDFLDLNDLRFVIGDYVDLNIQTGPGQSHEFRKAAF